jgi:nucleotide-binding universal stress UspA family protein
MTPDEPGAASSGPRLGPALFAFDGSELATLAIEQAARQLAPGREALITCVWQPVDVGFVPVEGRHFDAADAAAVREAAEEVAAAGVSLAERAGFNPERVVVQAAPTWKGLVELAEQREASLIVLGSHQRSGLRGHLLGSVAGAVVAHSGCSVLVVHS